MLRIPALLWVAVLRRISARASSLVRWRPSTCFASQLVQETHVVLEDMRIEWISYKNGCTEALMRRERRDGVWKQGEKQCKQMA